MCALSAGAFKKYGRKFKKVREKPAVSQAFPDRRTGQKGSQESGAKPELLGYIINIKQTMKNTVSFI